MDKNAFVVEYTSSEINSKVLFNFLKMLKNRGLIDNYENLYTNLIDKYEPNMSLEIELKKGKAHLLYINTKLNSISTGSNIDDYFSKNPNDYRFIILTEFTKKFFKQSLDYPNTQVFNTHEFMEEIPKKDIIPKHELLNVEDKQELLSKINANELPNIYEFDMMSRYYGAKPGDIFRITRNNITSGYGIAYRLVLPGKIDVMFEKKK
jgi:DNA-directed RNA polymerase subunit H (RpoH/RPB5)